MNEEKIIQKLFEHDDRFDRIEEKIEAMRNDFLTSKDEMMVILKRLDQERIFTIEWVKRIESKVEKQQQEIQHIKQVLKIA